MERKSRRRFLRDLGISLGSLGLVNALANAYGVDDKDKKKAPEAGNEHAPVSNITLKYAPRNWQSTYCFPDDETKSLVGRTGELLCGHPGKGQPVDAFGAVVAFGTAGGQSPTFLGQNLATAAVPIITTVLGWKGFNQTLVTFATNQQDEGRIDNVLCTFEPAGGGEAACTPEIVIRTRLSLTAEVVDDSAAAGGKITRVSETAGADHPYMIIDAAARLEPVEGGVRLVFSESTLSKKDVRKIFVRMPLEKQGMEKIRGRLKETDRLLSATRAFWEGWKPFVSPVDWNLPADHQQFLVASARNIAQARIMRKERPVYQLGPTVSRDFWILGGHFVLEAEHYLGKEKEATDGLRMMWDLQNSDGSFTSAAGPDHLKDTTVAIYSLLRHVELTDDWDMLNEFYPEAWRAVTYLGKMRESAFNDGTPNGIYGILPEGYTDTGIAGKSAELTNTLWALIVLPALYEVARKYMFDRRKDIADLNVALLRNFNLLKEKESLQYKGGFSYLPMIFKDDPSWKNSDPARRPKPQTAQIFLTQAIYPGNLWSRDNDIVKGHVSLMNSILKEDVPAETGSLTENAVWNCHAPVLANLLLWLGRADEARKIFTAFLNHASPLFAWREEQSIISTQVERYAGDMPDGWASAECIRFLRHMLVLEDAKDLRLLHGLHKNDVLAAHLVGVSSTPTKWGRVSLTVEPAPNRRYVVRYKRDPYRADYMPKIDHVILPRWIPEKLQIEKLTGAGFYKNGLEVFVEPQTNSWEAVYVDVERIH